MNNDNMDMEVHQLKNIKDTMNKTRTRLTESDRTKWASETKKRILLAQLPSMIHEVLDLTLSWGSGMYVD